MTPRIQFRQFINFARSNVVTLYLLEFTLSEGVNVTHSFRHKINCPGRYKFIKFFVEIYPIARVFYMRSSEILLINRGRKICVERLRAERVISFVSYFPLTYPLFNRETYTTYINDDTLENDIALDSPRCDSVR